MRIRRATPFSTVTAELVYGAACFMLGILMSGVLGPVYRPAPPAFVMPSSPAPEVTEEPQVSLDLTPDERCHRVLLLLQGECVALVDGAELAVETCEYLRDFCGYTS